MKQTERDISIVRHMVVYCEQIGELTAKLSEEFLETYTGAPWKQIKAMRNIIAHAYGTVDAEVTWEVVTVDIPKLKEYCRTILLNF